MSLEEAARELSFHPQGHERQQQTSSDACTSRGAGAGGVNFWTDYLKVGMHTVVLHRARVILLCTKRMCWHY